MPPRAKRGTCGCPPGSKRVETGRGAGFSCQGPRRVVTGKDGKQWVGKWRPFVPMVCTGGKR
jgi:hypothetical protein